MTNDELIRELEAMKLKIAELESEARNVKNAKKSSREKWMYGRVLAPVTVLCFLVLGTLAIGATVPNSFTAGDPISASQMNENFSYIISRLWEVTGANLHYSAGNIGIGTSSPTQKLEVIGTVDADAFTVNGTPVGTSTSSYWNESGGDLSYTLGNVGIGTATPQAKLDIYDGQIWVTDSAAAGNILALGFEGDYTGNENTWGTYILGNQLANRTLRMGVTNDGWAKAEIELENNNSINGDIYFKTNNVNNSPIIRMKIQNDGNVGIGTTTPAYQLELSTDSAGKPTSNTWTIVSDRRLKENIQPFEDGLETIMQIRPISYELNGRGNQPKGAKGISVVAQEAKDVIPYAISTFKTKLTPEDKQETELYNFNSSSLTFVLINAVKELKAANDDLKKQLAQLDNLKKRIAHLEQSL